MSSSLDGTPRFRRLILATSVAISCGGGVVKQVGARTYTLPGNEALLAADFESRLAGTTNCLQWHGAPPGVSEAFRAWSFAKQEECWNENIARLRQQADARRPEKGSRGDVAPPDLPQPPLVAPPSPSPVAPPLGATSDTAWSQAEQDFQSARDTCFSALNSMVARYEGPGVSDEQVTHAPSEVANVIANTCRTTPQDLNADARFAPIFNRLAPIMNRAKGLQAAAAGAAARARAHATQGSYEDCTRYCDGSMTCLRSCVEAAGSCVECCHVTQASATDEHCRAVCARNMRSFACR